MSECRRCRSQLVEAYYKELSAPQQEWVDAHLGHCPDCAAEFRKITSTLQMVNREAQPDPGAEFWDGYYARLQKRMAETQAKQVGEARPAGLRFGLSSKQNVRFWMYRVAAAIVFISIGLMIGKFYFGRPEVMTGRMTPRMSVPNQVDVRTANFLERSQILLVGMINMDTNRSDEPYDLSHQKQVSHELVREASYLKGELKDPRQRKLQRLVSELQVILTQIANMEEEEDLQSVDMVKSGVDRKGILLKINLEQMRMTDQKFQSASKPKL